MLGPAGPFTYLLGVWASLLYCLFYGVILILAMIFGGVGQHLKACHGILYTRNIAIAELNIPSPFFTLASLGPMVALGGGGGGGGERVPSGS